MSSSGRCQSHCQKHADMSGNRDFGLPVRQLEQLTIIIDSDLSASHAERMPQGNLVGREYRSAEIFFERGDHADGADGVSADEHGLRGGWHPAANPLVDLGRAGHRACVRVGNLDRWHQVADVYDLEASLLKLGSSFMVEVVGEVWAMDERDSFCGQGCWGRNRCRLACR